MSRKILKSCLVITNYLAGWIERILLSYTNKPRKSFFVGYNITRYYCWFLCFIRDPIKRKQRKNSSRPKILIY